MPFRNRLALQTVPSFQTLSTSFVPITGVSITVKARSTFYVDLRFYLVQTGASSGAKIRIDGWTPQIGNSPNPDGPSFLTWTFYNIQDQTKYEQGNVSTAAENMEWELPSTILRGDAYIFGLIRNDEDFDQQLTVSASVVIPFNALFIQGARLIIFEEVQSRQNTVSIMSNCGCCIDAQLSCCQNSIQIQTQNPSATIKWKIDGVGDSVYTGQFDTDADGLGEITIGDGLDLPDGFLDAPHNFRIQFIETAPKIATFVECIDVDIVGGAYLAINQIGETTE